jgi:lipid A 3-O-deacylase
MRPFLIGAAALALAAAAGPARADGGIFSEVRLGVLAHDAQIGNGFREGGADINGELLFTSPVAPNTVDFAPPYVRWLLEPRPMVGFEANTSGYTSQGYAGVTWTAALFDNVFRPGDGVLFDLGFGPSVNDGHVDEANGPFKRIGSNVLFHTDIDLGYRISQHWAAYVEVDHESNAGLAKANQGLTQAGVRFGYLF